MCYIWGYQNLDTLQNHFDPFFFPDTKLTFKCLQTHFLSKRWAWCGGRYSLVLKSISAGDTSLSLGVQLSGALKVTPPKNLISSELTHFLGGDPTSPKNNKQRRKTGQRGPPAGGALRPFDHRGLSAEGTLWPQGPKHQDPYCCAANSFAILWVCMTEGSKQGFRFFPWTPRTPQVFYSGGAGGSEHPPGSQALKSI